MISLDLDEILTVCDRLAVIYEGKIVSVMDRRDANVDDIGLMMGGKVAVASEGKK